MNLSPSDRAAVIDLAAEKLAKDLRQECDLSELMSVPVSMVSQLTGLSRSQIERTFTLRPMGKRRNGVSLKSLTHYVSKL